MLYELIGIVRPGWRTTDDAPGVRSSAAHDAIHPFPLRIADSAQQQEAKEAKLTLSPLGNRIVLGAGQLILQHKGVIRGISNWGVFSLPKATSVHQMRHNHGHYFAMRFDSSVAAQQAVRNMLALDPRMIRHSSVKLGDGKLESISRVGPGVEWRR
ncbi:hypothetical protein DL765_001776 [Monosporascus sp. GIB2]|nr:hypothetical protein DL765_001776 [Monosporascus sp. GIB2]